MSDLLTEPDNKFSEFHMWEVMEFFFPLAKGWHCLCCLLLFVCLFSFFIQLFSAIDSGSKHFYMSVLCTYMTSEYKSELPVSEMNPPFLRALKTAMFAGTPVCPYLEQPNLVSGLPAQCKWRFPTLNKSKRKIKKVQCCKSKLVNDGISKYYMAKNS